MLVPLLRWEAFSSFGFGVFFPTLFRKMLKAVQKRSRL